MNITVIDKQSDLAIAKTPVIALIQEALQLEGVCCDEVSIHFVDVQTISELHSQFFDDPTTTDCISLPIDLPGSEGYCVLGEVFVCPQVAIEYAETHGENPYHETSLYIVHGLLHLLGYNDIGDEEPAMRAAERKHMSNLATKNLLLTKQSEESAL